jgi:hypothetical protein
MIYSYFIEKLARQTFAHVQNHNYEEVLKALAPNVSHHFAGDHALGGTRHDRESVRRWFNRLGTVLPNLRFDVKTFGLRAPRGGRRSSPSGWRPQRWPMAIRTSTLASISSAYGGAMPTRSTCLRTLRPWQRAWLNRPKRGSRKLRLPRSKADLAAPAIAVALDRNSCAPSNVRYWG